MKKIILALLLSAFLPASILTINCLPAQALSESASNSFLPIDHIVIIVKENHTYDNYFGLFPGGNGATHGMTSDGRIIRLQHAADPPPHDIVHTHEAAATCYDGGKMDGFDLIRGGNQNGDYLAYSQYYEEDIPNYWAYARRFALCDNFFTSALGPSFPNHLFTIAAQSGNAIDNPRRQEGGDSVGVPYWGCDAKPEVMVEAVNSTGGLFEEYPCFNFKTLADTLNEKGLSWNYYAPQKGDFGYHWSAFDAISHIRNASQWTTNVLPVERFITDARKGVLPNVSWIVTDRMESEHPAEVNCRGENTTVAEINAVMAGPLWPRTAIFITWDDFGGWYDHVPPKQIDSIGLGMRVPCIVVSPYAKNGYIAHRLYEFSSIVKTVEDAFGLPALSARDANAEDMFDCFDFNREPTAPYLLQERNCPK